MLAAVLTSLIAFHIHEPQLQIALFDLQSYSQGTFYFVYFGSPSGVLLKPAAIEGEYTAEGALCQLLKDTGMSFTVDDSPGDGRYWLYREQDHPENPSWRDACGPNSLVWGPDSIRPPAVDWGRGVYFDESRGRWIGDRPPNPK